MDFFGLIVGFLISAIALYVWYRFHRSITRGEEFSLWPAKKVLQEGESNEAAEAFVAARAAAYSHGAAASRGDLSAALKASALLAALSA